MVVFACYCTYDAVSEARATTVRNDRASEFSGLVAPLKSDLAELGIAPDALLGYQDALLARPVGTDVYSGLFLHLTRLFLAPLRLVHSTEPEWLLVVRLEGAVPGLDLSGFRRVKRYQGMDLYRRAQVAPPSPTPREEQ
jgi:hypothetical protein